MANKFSIIGLSSIIIIMIHAPTDPVSMYSNVSQMHVAMTEDISRSLSEFYE